MILDAHVHFWDPQARRHAWLDGHPALRRRFGAEDYDAGRHEVGGMVFVQADCRDHETLDEAAAAAGRDPERDQTAAHHHGHPHGRKPHQPHRNRRAINHGCQW